MTDKNETVTLIAPNGQTVSVAASKKELRIAAGYRIPEDEAPKRSPGRPKASSE